MRPLASIWEKGLAKRFFFPESDAVLTFYGPDVDTSRYGTFAGNTGSQGALQATISNVIDPVQVRRLPFAGRDVYTMLVTLPGVVSDAGTGRGLGLSINGQRPSASNFLLDGLENNNSFLSGPLSTVAPEAIQEYRVSTANFSAEYGRTSGFLANAVTRSGGSSPRQRAEFRRQLPEFASVMGWIGRSASVYRLLVRQRNPQRIEDFCLAGVGNRQPCDAGLLIHSIFQ